MQTSPIFIRCPQCNKLLAKAEVPLGVPNVLIELHCTRCETTCRWPSLQAEIVEKEVAGKPTNSGGVVSNRV